MSAAIELSERLRRDARFVDAVVACEPILRKELGDSVNADWDIEGDDGQTTIALRLRDAHEGVGGQATTNFAPDELESHEGVGVRVHRARDAMVRVGEWRGQVAALFATLRTWLAAEPEIRIQESPLIVREERSGEYSLAQLKLARAEKWAIVKPIGAWIVGADGRVDLVGAESKHNLVLSRREGGWLWIDDRTVVRLRPLTASIFLDLVRDCME